MPPLNERLNRLRQRLGDARRSVADSYKDGFRKVGQFMSRWGVPCPGCVVMRRWFGGARVDRAHPAAKRPPLTTERDLVRHFTPRDYPRSRQRRYALHLPPQYDGQRQLPLVMVLHGCRQDEQDIRQISGFDAIADQEGFAVVYPFVTSYGGLRNRNCWGWWHRHEIEAGAGEVEDLWQIMEEVANEFHFDQRRLYVAGLSSGAGMAVAMLVAHADRIAAGAAVAGLPYGESARAVNLWGFTGRFKPVDEVVRAMRGALPKTARPVPLMIVHSDADETVDIRAADNLRDSWGRCFGIDTAQPQARTSGVTHDTPWISSRYGDPVRNGVVETLILEGRGHGWYGGEPGPFSYPEAPDVSRWIWDFFYRQPPLTLEHAPAPAEAATA